LAKPELSGRVEMKRRGRKRKFEQVETDPLPDCPETLEEFKGCTLPAKVWYITYPLPNAETPDQSLLRHRAISVTIEKIEPGFLGMYENLTCRVNNWTPLLFLYCPLRDWEKYFRRDETNFQVQKGVFELLEPLPWHHGHQPLVKPRSPQLQREVDLIEMKGSSFVAFTKSEQERHMWTHWLQNGSVGIEIDEYDVRRLQLVQDSLKQTYPKCSMSLIRIMLSYFDAA